MGTRLELRSVDPMANPYIAMAVLLEVGLHGIENKIEAPAPIEENIYIMTAEERKEAGITDLPSTLHNALKALFHNGKLITTWTCTKQIYPKMS